MSRSTRYGWPLTGIVLLGVIVRFPTLGQQSFWYDEAITHGIVSHGLGHVLSTVPGSESTPPLYYVLVWLWSQLFGSQEVGLRSFSALCGTLTIPLMWLLGRQLVSDRVGLFAALLTAVNPLLFWYSQEARAYALLVLLSTLSLLTLVWALQAPSPRRLLAWGALSALALSAHYFAVFLIAAEAVWLVVSLRRAGAAGVGPVLCALAPIAAIGAALLPLAVHQNDGRAGYIANDSGSLGLRLAQLVKQDIVANDEPFKVPTSIVAGLLVALGLLLLVRRASRPERAGALLPLVLGSGTVLLALFVALLGTDYVNTRNLLPSWPALALVIAGGYGAVEAGRTGALAISALTAISLVCVAGVIMNPLFQRADWRGAAQAMGSVGGPRAIVAGHLAQAALRPYMSGLSDFPPSMDVQEVDVFALIYRPAGAHTSLPAPRADPPPALPGFRMVQRRETEGYTVLRYRSPAPMRERPAALIRLGLVPGAVVALLQKPT